jgi:uncharacterized protein (TIGR03086 family)
MPDRTDSSASHLTTAERLVTLGRDREAVAAAMRDSSPRVTCSGRDRTTQQGRPMEPMQGAGQLDELMPLLEAVVARISPEQLDDPTPCATFTVAGVLEHMISGATAFAPAFRGDPAPSAEGAASSGTLRERWGQAMADLMDAVHSAGAADRTIAAPFGEVPGSVFARFVAFDGLVHGWDLATATGQPYAPREQLVGEIDAFARQTLTADLRDGDTFAAETEVPANAGPLEQLVAFSGRQLPSAQAGR